MRNLVTVILLLIGSSAIAQQFNYYVNFENEIDTHHIKIFIDSNESNNIWNIAYPNKSYFNKTDSISTALITDSINAYPTNNKSTLFIHIPTTDSYNYGSKLRFLNFSFYYRVDTDSLNDFGQLEISISDDDHYFKPTLDSSFIEFLYVKELTGRSGWELYEIYFLVFPEYFHDLKPDYFRFKITFNSDSIFDDRDGLMIDEIFYEKSYSLDIPETLISSNPLLYPTHIANCFYINESYQNVDYKLKIYDIYGKLVWEAEKNFSNCYCPPISSGTHILIFDSENVNINQKIIKL